MHNLICSFCKVGLQEIIFIHLTPMHKMLIYVDMFCLKFKMFKVIQAGKYTKPNHTLTLKVRLKPFSNAELLKAIVDSWQFQLSP